MGFAEELLNDLVTESRENLDAIEPELLKMEKDPENISPDTLNSVFRAIHSIKGSAGSFSFESLKNLSHCMESVFVPIRNGRFAITREIMDVLLRGVDKLRAMIDDIHASDSVPCEEEIDEFKRILSENTHRDDLPQSGLPVLPSRRVSKTVDETMPEREAMHAECDLGDKRVRALVERGMFVYRVNLNIGEDLLSRGMDLEAMLKTMSSVGQVIALPDRADKLDLTQDSDTAFSLVFASVLEPKFLPEGIALPADRIEEIDVSAMKQRIAESRQAHSTRGASVAESNVAGPLDVGGNDASNGAKPSGGETLRVRVDLLTRLMNTVGELVLGRNRLMSALDGHGDSISGLGEILQDIDHVTSELQESVMQTRMQPIGLVFGRFSRVVRDLARKLGKEIELRIEGSDVEMDKSIIELLCDPLMHIVRNCADHALETPEQRHKGGKLRTGLIHLRAYHESGMVNVSISDDGRGIDSRKVLAKAVEMGLVTNADAVGMSDQEAVNLILAPGFSMAEKVTDISGRGVGMDVVRNNIEKLGGHIQIDTQVDKGTTLLLRLPLTLAIVPALIVGTEGQRFAVPQQDIVELLCIRAKEAKNCIQSVHGACVVRIRDMLLPLVRLSDVLGMARTYRNAESGLQGGFGDRRESIVDRRAGNICSDDLPVPGEECWHTTHRQGDGRRASWRSDYNIMVLRSGNHKFGVIVDSLFDSEEIVVKALSSLVKGSGCFSGSTIMGDGRVVMIIDAVGLADRAALSFTDRDSEVKRYTERLAGLNAASSANRRSVILLKNAPGEYLAIPQDKVLRLERISASDIKRIGDREFIHYRGSGLPLIRLEDHLSLERIGHEQQELFVIIPKHSGYGSEMQAKAGIIAAGIVDALDVDVSLDEGTVSGPGMQGTAIVNEHLTIFLDPVEFVDKVCSFREAG